MLHGDQQTLRWSPTWKPTHDVNWLRQIVEDWCILEERMSWYNLLRRCVDWVLNPKLEPNDVPELTTPQMLDEIDAAITAMPDGSLGGFSIKWLEMDKKSRLQWVERRKIALLVVWVRGGNDGFQGLGIRLLEALGDIDR